MFGALAATLAATAWVASTDREPDDFAPVARAALPRPDEPSPPAPQNGPAVDRPQVRAPGDVQIDLDRLKRDITPSGTPAYDAFARHTWYVAPPPPRPAPPPRPVAPPLPFKFMGRYSEGGKDLVFITGQQDRNYVVASGDTIEGTYRIESISERSMTLTYLPLGEQQALPLPQ